MSRHVAACTAGHRTRMWAPVREQQMTDGIGDLIEAHNGEEDQGDTAKGHSFTGCFCRSLA